MKLRQKKIKDQVIVITGASSGIGLATAKLAAQRGARLVLSSRNDKALSDICQQFGAQGTEAIYVVADVADFDAVRRIADRAIEKFGGFDTWFNNAATTIFGELLQVQPRRRAPPVRRQLLGCCSRESGRDCPLERARRHIDQHG